MRPTIQFPACHHCHSATDRLPHVSSSALELCAKTHARGWNLSLAGTQSDPPAGSCLDRSSGNSAKSSDGCVQSRFRLHQACVCGQQIFQVIRIQRRWRCLHVYLDSLRVRLYHSCDAPLPLLQIPAAEAQRGSTYGVHVTTRLVLTLHTHTALAWASMSQVLDCIRQPRHTDHLMPDGERAAWTTVMQISKACSSSLQPRMST